MPDNSTLRKQVKRFVQKADERDLRIIYQIFEMNKEEDWWNEIGEDQKSVIKEAITEANRGKVVPHSEMVKKYRKWLRK
ncbi:MAG: hypothetical protein ABR502_07525 [Chitinophagaceae bacterium]